MSEATKKRLYDFSVAATGTVIFVYIAYAFMWDAVQLSANFARWIVGR